MGESICKRLCGYDGQRVGEADNPGSTFNIISANVTSFLSHLDYLATLDGDVVAVQEVRLAEDAITIANDRAMPFYVAAGWWEASTYTAGYSAKYVRCETSRTGHFDWETPQCCTFAQD